MSYSEWNLCKNKFTIYSSEAYPNDAQYLIAVCSNFKIKKPDPQLVTMSQVKNFGFKRGFFSLEKQFDETRCKLNDTLSQLAVVSLQKDNLKAELDKIKSSKLYFIWRVYRKCRKILQFHASSI